MKNEPTNARETYERIKARAARFIDRQLAFEHAATTVKPHRVMLGDDGRYWVVTPADAARLERMGYEYAN
jgi:hypothetical protein